MSTQVSWIEPEKLRALVGQLQGGTIDTDRSAWEVHTLPSEMGLGARDLGIIDDDLWLPNEISPAIKPDENVSALLQTEGAPVQRQTEPDVIDDDEEDPIQQDKPLPFIPLAEGSPIELNRIRQKLQAIREKAIGAGLLAHLPTPEVAASLEVEAPPPAPAFFKEPPPPTGPDPVGHTGPLESNDLPSHPLPSARICSPFGVAGEPASTVDANSPPAASFIVPMGSIMQRLNAFAEWASAHLQTHELIISDDHGDVLWGDAAHAGLLVSTMMASKAALRSTALGACDPQSLIEQPISPGRTLIVVPCDTPFGTLSVAFIRSFSISGSDALLLRRNIGRAVNNGSKNAPPSGEIH